MNGLEFTPTEGRYEGLHTGNRERVLAKLAKINLKLAKMGAPAATITWGPIVERAVVSELTAEIKHRWQEYEFVIVHGVEVRHAGWTGVASLDHSLGTDEAFVTRFPNHHETEIPNHFRSRGPVCDHCNVKIARNLTVLFAHDDGRWVQLGTSCVLEYIGVDPATVLWLAAPLYTSDEEDGWEPKGGRYYARPLDVIAAAAEATREQGFVKSADQHRVPTKQHACNVVYGVYKSKDMNRELPNFDAARGAADAEAIIAWVAASKDRNDFMTNAKVACSAEIATERTVGILASLPSVYWRDQTKMLERQAGKAEAPSDFLGEVGQKKFTATGIVTTLRQFDSQFGVKRVVIVTVASGHQIKTVGTGQTLWNVAQGDEATITGTVVGHQDDQYGRHTVVKMAKMVKIVAGAA